MKKYIATGLVCLGLAGCIPIGGGLTVSDVGSLAPTGHTAVYPTGRIDVGHLYFSGKGRLPQFATTDGRIFNKLCYDDFAQTGALKDIGNHVIDNGVRISSRKAEGKISGNLNVTASELSRIASLSIYANASDTYENTLVNVHELTLTQAGEQIVRQSIGDNCRELIAQYRRAGRDVILVVSGYRAEKVTTKNVRAAGGGGQVQTAPGSILGGIINISGGSSGGGNGAGGDYSRTYTAEYPRVYISVVPVDF